MMRRLILPLAFLIAGCERDGAIAPGQIVSNTPCVDAVLAEIAAPGQIGAVSIWSQDPASASAPVAWARAHPALGLTAEEIIAVRPKLLLTGNLATGGTNEALRKAGIPMRTYGVPVNVADSIAQVRDIAAAIDRVAAGEKLVRRIADAAAPRILRRPLSAIIWQSDGYVPGQGTLQDDLLARAGYRNASVLYGLKQWDILPTERVLASPPDLIFMPKSANGTEGRELTARRRLLAHLGARTRIMPFPDKLLFCGGPSIIEAMHRLKAAA